MSSCHPRRSTKTTSSALTPLSPPPSSSSSSTASGRRPVVNTSMSLRKGATFHSPTTPERELPLRFKVPALPRRSQTTLEDVVDAHKRRVALTLGDIDRGLSSLDDPSSPTARPSFPDQADPVPQGFLNHTVGSPATASYGSIMESVADAGPSRRTLRPRQSRRPSRYSDSALGSSIGSGSQHHDALTVPTTVSGDDCAKSSVAASAITRSAAAHTSTIESLPRLSARASNRIQEHVLRPLLAKPSLKDFHAIVKECPRRIHQKEIVCLRDLEKTLIFMAPERTKSAALYLDFCLTSIRCIQATVDYLSDHEQTRPHDRPYTNGYFIDLVDQIKQYAQQIQAAKEKEEKGEAPGEMDPETTDEVRLHGGLTKNGRPAELVRVKKNGKAISMATGKPVELDDDKDEAMRFKRSLSEEAEDDESIMRSMARRKRSASAAELAPKRCREPGCDKEFKRPCDLTKHEKTHSRPWKCPVESCKYHEYGWPTEKEMDRHHNDKHSAAPALYECKFKPCPYRSKRESNCKQHMEKAHGWEYVRSKNNGKNREQPGSTTNGLPTPQTTHVRTPSSDGNAAATPDDEDFDMDTSYEGVTFLDQQQNQINFPTYYNNPEMDGMFGSGNHQLNLDYSPISDANQLSSSEHSPYVMNTMQGQDQHFTDNFHDFSGNVDFSLYENEDLYSARAQIPTPSHDVFKSIQQPFEHNGVRFGADPVPHISPIGHGNTMLYTPTSLLDVDEGFEDFAAPSHCNLGPDFQLFPSSTGGTVTSSAPSALFGEIPSGNPTLDFANMSAQELLDYYAASIPTVPMNQHNNGGMDWSSDMGFGGYGSGGH